MTVLIYVDTRKQVGDPEDLKVFADMDAAEAEFVRTMHSKRKNQNEKPGNRRGAR